MAYPITGVQRRYPHCENPKSGGTRSGCKALEIPICALRSESAAPRDLAQRPSLGDRNSRSRLQEFDPLVMAETCDRMQILQRDKDSPLILGAAPQYIVTSSTSRRRRGPQSERIYICSARRGWRGWQERSTSAIGSPGWYGGQ
jgi:hypothetical protein